MEYFNLTEEIYNKISGLVCEWLKHLNMTAINCLQNICSNHSKEYIHYLCPFDT